ncbi:MAG TPA: carboxyltransferase domain-containing protein, partial [Saprospiraceae bacterium]|nr:carboxyltransferase domain-containing protein [Saprospiraceae bacterium]
KYFDRTFFVPEGIICWPHVSYFDAMVIFVSLKQTPFDEVIFGLDSISFINFGKSQKEIVDLIFQHFKDFNPKQENSNKIITHEVPIYYDMNGKDLAALSISLQMDKEEIIYKHQHSSLQVAMIGFLPGFIYLKGLDEAIISNRKKIPSPRIAPGSVGIAETFTGIYPIQSPGGWNIIGFCPIKLFDVQKKPAVNLKIGDDFRFYSITAQEYAKLNAHG